MLFAFYGNSCDIFALNFSYASVEVTQTDPGWVGAWWIGPLICFLIFIVVSFPMLGFPPRLKGVHRVPSFKLPCLNNFIIHVATCKCMYMYVGWRRIRALKKAEVHADLHELPTKKTTAQVLKDFPVALKQLVTNGTVMAISLAGASECE